MIGQIHYRFESEADLDVLVEDIEERREKGAMEFDLANAILVLLEDERLEMGLRKAIREKAIH